MQLILLFNLFAVENFAQLDMAISPGMYQFKNQIFDKTIPFNTMRLSGDEVWLDFAPTSFHHHTTAGNNEQKFQGYTFGISHFFKNRSLVGIFIDSHKNDITYLDGGTYNNKLDLLSFGIYGNITSNKMNYLWLVSHTSASGDNYQLSAPIVVPNFKVKSKALQTSFEANRIFRTILGDSFFFKPFIGIDLSYIIFGNFYNLISNGSFVKSDITLGSELKYQKARVELLWKLYLRQILSGRTATSKSLPVYDALGASAVFHSTSLESTYVGISMAAKLGIFSRLSLIANGTLEIASDQKYISYIFAGLNIPILPRS